MVIIDVQNNKMDFIDRCILLKNRPNEPGKLIIPAILTVAALACCLASAGTCTTLAGKVTTGVGAGITGLGAALGFYRYMSYQPPENLLKTCKEILK